MRKKFALKSYIGFSKAFKKCVVFLLALVMLFPLGALAGVDTYTPDPFSSDVDPNYVDPNYDATYDYPYYDPYDGPYDNPYAPPYNGDDDCNCDIDDYCEYDCDCDCPKCNCEYNHDYDYDYNYDCDYDCDCDYDYDSVVDKDEDSLDEPLFIAFDGAIVIYAHEIYENPDLYTILLQGVSVTNEQGEDLADKAEVQDDGGFAMFVNELLAAFECETGMTEMPDMPFETEVTYRVICPETDEVIVSEPRELRVQFLGVVAVATHTADNVDSQEAFEYVLSYDPTIPLNIEITSDFIISGNGILIDREVNLSGSGGAGNPHRLEIEHEDTNDERHRHFYVKGGTLNLHDGLILTRQSGREMCAGGVEVGDVGIFNMYGSEITGNRYRIDGGGVRVYGTGVFSMIGGSINNNYAAYGGGFSMHGAGMVYISGGTISGNRAVGSDYFPPSPDFPDFHEANGGGFWIGPSGHLRIGYFGNDTDNPIIISGNTATNVGGGVFTYHEDSVVEVFRGTFSDNVAWRGGAIYTANLRISNEEGSGEDVGIGLIQAAAIFRNNRARDGFRPAFLLDHSGFNAGLNRFWQITWHDAGGNAWTPRPDDGGVNTGTSLNRPFVNPDSPYHENYVPPRTPPVWVHLINNYDIYGAGFPETTEPEVDPDWVRLRDWIEDADLTIPDNTITIHPFGSTGVTENSATGDFVLQDARWGSANNIFFANATREAFGYDNTTIEVGRSVILRPSANSNIVLLRYKEDAENNESPCRHFNVVADGSLTLQGNNGFSLTLDGNRPYITSDGDSGGVRVSNNASFIMSAGEIRNSRATRGGAIYVEADAALLDISGGSISNNRAAGTTATGDADGGGGIFIHGATNSPNRIIGAAVTFSNNSAATGWVANVGNRSTMQHISWHTDGHSLNLIPGTTDAFPYEIHLLNNYDVNFNPPLIVPNIHFGAWDFMGWLEENGNPPIALGDWRSTSRPTHNGGVPLGGSWGDFVNSPTPSDTNGFTPIMAPLGNAWNTIQIEASQPNDSEDMLAYLLYSPNGDPGSMLSLSTPGGISISSPESRLFRWSDIDIQVYSRNASNTQLLQGRPPERAVITWSFITPATPP